MKLVILMSLFLTFSCSHFGGHNTDKCEAKKGKCSKDKNNCKAKKSCKNKAKCDAKKKKACKKDCKKKCCTKKDSQQTT
jgi:hypothetical protein